MLLCVHLSENITNMWTNRACGRTKSKQKQNQIMLHSNWPRVLLFYLAHKQCNGMIKGLLHCLTLESKGKFLVNNILIFGSAWCLVMAQIQFSLIIKKDWTSRTLANPPPSTSNKISFLSYPPAPSKWTSMLKQKEKYQDCCFSELFVNKEKWKKHENNFSSFEP